MRQKTLAHSGAGAPRQSYMELLKIEKKAEKPRQKALRWVSAAVYAASD